MRALVHALVLVAPVVSLSSLASFAFASTTEAIVEARALLVALPALGVVLGVASQRRADWIFPAQAVALATFGLAVYALAASTGAHPATSLVDRPSMLIALLATSLHAAACFALSDPER